MSAMATDAQAATDDLEAADAEGLSQLAIPCKSLRWCPAMGALPGELSHPAHVVR